MTATVTFLPIESRGFITYDFHAEAALSLLDGEHAMPEQPLEGSYVKLRVTASEEEARALDTGQLRQALLDLGAHSVWVELDVQRETRARVAGVDETISDTDALEKWLDSQGVNGDQAPALRARHNDYVQEIT